MTAADLRVGDVVRVPGYNSTQKPGRLHIVDDSEANFSNVDSDPKRLTLRLSDAVSMFPKYCKPLVGFDGFFWAIEREGRQIWPEVKG